MKKILNNIKDVKTTALGIAVMIGAYVCLYKGIIDGTAFTLICAGAAFPILGIGQKKSA